MQKSTDNGPLAEKVRQTSLDLNGYHNTLSMSPSYYYFLLRKKQSRVAFESDSLTCHK